MVVIFLKGTFRGCWEIYPDTEQFKKIEKNEY
jgi:hypothetical protein